jgi:hypothetical protein
MSANDDTGSKRKRLCQDDNGAYFVYHGQENENEDVPQDVIHIQVHPSVMMIRQKAFFQQSLLMSVELHDGIKVINKEAFEYCRSLRKILFPPSVRAIKDFAFYYCSESTTVILNDGLEEIGKYAFNECASLVRIDIPPTVRAIKYRAFASCSGLTTAILNDGLEEIDERVFADCISLVRIDIPLSVRVIKKWAFEDCSELTTVILNDGLEEIEGQAFEGCAFVRIVIPPAVKAIDETAFEECSNLTTVRFCDEIEEFVSAESMRHWWNNGVHEKCLSTYCFFVQCNIPEHVGLVQSATLQTSIHGMLERIPSISPKGLNSYFCSIDSKLSAYEAKLSAYEGSTMLELAIWKSEIAEQTDGNINLLTPDMKMRCHIDSLWVVDIIVLNVLSFLRGDANEGDDSDEDNEGDDDDSDKDDGDGDDEY